LGLATVAGLCFGIYLVVINISSAHNLLWRLIFSRVASASLAGAVVIWLEIRSGNDATRWRKQARENRFLWIAASAGVLEAMGSLLYMQSATEGRLDVAAVLASLYPVVTIVLAAWFLKERATSSQALGMALALGAVVLVSL
jgi:drug/metabolite transporter (DMT)-like permease